MKTTIDRAGRIVVPRALRRALGLEPGSEVELRAADGLIEMEPVPLEVRMERRGGLLVAVSKAKVPPMPESAAQGVMATLRTGRTGRARRR